MPAMIGRAKLDTKSSECGADFDALKDVSSSHSSGLEGAHIQLDSAQIKLGFAMAPTRAFLG
jgi:hypothetical protein